MSEQLRTGFNRLEFPIVPDLEPELVPGGSEDGESCWLGGVGSLDGVPVGLAGMEGTKVAGDWKGGCLALAGCNTEVWVIVEGVFVFDGIVLGRLAATSDDRHLWEGLERHLL